MICKRCGREFSNPIPEITEPEGHREVASAEWCADCNSFAMSIVFRNSSAYRKKKLYDPVRGGTHAEA